MMGSISPATSVHAETTRPRFESQNSMHISYRDRIDPMDKMHAEVRHKPAKCACPKACIQKNAACCLRSTTAI